MSAWAEDENNDNLKHNKKLRVIGNGTQLENIPVTSEGQLCFCTSSTSLFPKNKLRARLAGNSSWSGILAESSEYNSGYLTATPPTASIGATKQFFRKITLPSTEKFYIITGIEWTNGSTISGTVMSGVSLKNGNSTPYVAICQEVAHAGADSVQRVSVVRAKPILAGTDVYAWMQTSSATSTFSLSINADNGNTFSRGSHTYSGTPPTSENATVSAETTLPIIKMYYRGYE